MRPAPLTYTYDQISVHVCGLASLGISTEQYGSLLIPIVMSKLPNENQLQVVRNSTDDIWKIEDLLHMIKKEVEAHETSEQVEKNEACENRQLENCPLKNCRFRQQAR